MDNEGFDDDGIPILHAFQNMDEEIGIDPETAEYLQQQAEHMAEIEDIDRTAHEYD
jgi:hypothetical protein